jgi:uncharacterized protein with HEPN domain
MQRELDAYLNDILKAIDFIETFIAGSNFESYEGNALLQAAVERKFEIIGEAMKQAESLYPGSLASLPKARLAMGLRDRLAHGYFAIDPIVPWDAISRELPALKEAVKMLSHQIP